MIIRISSQNPNEATALAQFCAEVADGTLIEGKPPVDKDALPRFYQRYYTATAVARDIMFERNPAEHKLDTLTDVIKSFWKTFGAEHGFGAPTSLDIKYLDMKADAAEDDAAKGRTFYIFPNAAPGYRVLCF